ncbi:MAG: hypothetical protein QG597_3738 [Actinomycetota bacterium]|nr:hypothetical protein [Actinomycetota bacterium]
MGAHPPWLRFQAYLVGLPKTGSTSVATMFGRYRTGHEWQLMELVEAGMARQSGALSDDEFLAAVGPRLTAPSLEMDSATGHHLYADVLRDRFPNAVFVHTVRDVRSWTSSLLDMVLRKRIARASIELPYSSWETDYLALMTEGTYDLRPECVDDDSAALPALMRYWAEHMRQMAEVLPAERTLRVRTDQLARRAPALARLTGVSVQILRTDLSHANQAPRSLDRFATFDSPALRAAYDRHCGAIMAEVFPEAHERWQAQPPPTQSPQDAWAAYHVDLTRWVDEAIAQHGPTVAR